MLTFGDQNVQPRAKPPLTLTRASVPTAAPMAKKRERLNDAAEEMAEGNSVGRRGSVPLGASALPCSKPCNASFHQF